MRFTYANFVASMRSRRVFVSNGRKMLPVTEVAAARNLVLTSYDFGTLLNEEDLLERASMLVAKGNLREREIALIMTSENSSGEYFRDIIIHRRELGQARLITRNYQRGAGQLWHTPANATDPDNTRYLTAMLVSAWALLDNPELIEVESDPENVRSVKRCR